MAKFRKGQSGNPAGKPKGAKHKVTLAMEALLDGEAETITRKAIEKAKNGEDPALRLVLERILPPRRDRPVKFELPKLEKPSDSVRAAAAIAEGVAAGDLTPSEASEIGSLVNTYIRAIEVTEHEERLRKLETGVQ